MTALYASMEIAGGALCLIAVVWAWRTRVHRRVWRKSRYQASTVAIVLELEDKVRELEEQSAAPIDVR